ncbi:Glycosyltransferase involved in cell wall bisynthesis [Monaibacterium marinum]|uniref:Glycosyltransferase involved in cell wall bisynthesis n=1 Tax=Pontivivens marinum TaxID=1690039 RepID=A0A2C9CVR1_9RHOB|nr:glycosyltransferase family 4 protein [Monaibacterium marinum]SOH95456.1 Glycosyltransferase involved in cell wall bisynthesis [Monaibacterium marinum]
MKILILHNAYQQRGGEDAVVAAEETLLRAAGHDVDVEVVSNTDIHGLSAKVRTFLRTAYDPQREAWMRDLLARTGAEVVHIHNFFPRLTPAVHTAAAQAGVGVVQTLHNYRLLCAGAQFLREGRVCEDCLTGSILNGIRHRCYRGSLPGSLAVVNMQHQARQRETFDKHVHRFIALTDFARDKFIEGGLPAERIVVKPNFIHAPEQPEGQGRAGALFVGRLSAEKGVQVLVDAWRALPDIPLTILGDGPEADALRASSPSNVHFAGSVTPAEVRAHMLKARALMMPSLWYEGFPMTIAEAFGAGLPVIASRLGSMAEIVTPGRTGALFEPGNVQDLTDTVRATFADPDTLTQLGRAARDQFQHDFSPAANLGQLEKIYDEAKKQALRG